MTCVSIVSNFRFYLCAMLVLRKCLFLFLACAVFAQQGSKTFILLDYLVNKKYISTVLCENRNRPQCHCNGKCHLRKEFKNDDERQGNDKQNLIEKKEISFWENHFRTELDFRQFSEKITFNRFDFQIPYSAELPLPFHPPCA